MSCRTSWIVFLCSMFNPFGLPAIPAADCNGNGIEDDSEIAEGIATDCNENGIPDDCDITPRLGWETEQAISIGGYPNAVAAGDWNGDGLVDLAATAGTDRRIVILMNEGGRRFTTTSEWAISEYPRLLPDPVDIDEDGDLDILTTVGGIFHVLLGDGQGGFAEPASLQVGGDGAQAGDVDGDGFLDLIVDQDASGIAVLWGTGYGEFSDVESLGGGQVCGVGAGDLDGDGDLDIAYAKGSTHQLYILRNLGDRTFEERDTSTHISCNTPRPLDLDGDGDLDLVADSRYEFLLPFNDGTGGFRDEDTHRLPFPIRLVGMATADVDGDGDVDIFAKSESVLALLI
ncbi:MAG: VCBS repeat-containing protein, partial [Planctomycetes bacterium]|nr:VCBS repeat-containing protein [Planctomycetota bacterium]